MAAGFKTIDELLAEFSSVLREHSYGIASHSSPLPAQDTPLRATAELGLLDQSSSICVELSQQAYTLVSCTAGPTHVGKTFDSLTALLSATSPEFNKAMHAELCAKLLGSHTDLASVAGEGS